MTATVTILVWVVCGLVGALIFQSKNRSPATGGIIGILFGPVGVLVLAFYGKRTEAEAAAEPLEPGQIGTRKRRD